MLIIQVNTTEKDDKICQTEAQIECGQQQEYNLSLKSEDSTNLKNYHPKSIDSTEVRSNSSNSNRFFSHTNAKD